MTRVPAEKVVRSIIHQPFPTLPRQQRRALARWVMGALLAGSAHGPSVIQALATAGVAAPSTLSDQWDAWLAQPAYQTTEPPHAEAPPLLSPLACGTWLLRWVVQLWTEDFLVLGVDASLRRDEVGLLRISVLYRATAIPVAWVMVPANTPGAWQPHWERMLCWVATAIPAEKLVLVMADRGLWSPRLWQAIVAQSWHPVLRIQGTATFAPTGEGRQRVTQLIGGPGHAWSGEGTAFKHTPKRIRGTMAAVWDPEQKEPWALLTELPASQMDAAWYALRMWDEEGFRQSKSMGWDWQRGQLERVDAVAWQYLVVAVATLWALAVGTRIEDAQQQRMAPGRLRRPPCTSVPCRRRRSGTALRMVSLLQQGCQKLRWMLARGRIWVGLWLRPEPLPETPNTIRVHIHSPSPCGEMI
jgi:hypothetical protein